MSSWAWAGLAWAVFETQSSSDGIFPARGRFITCVELRSVLAAKSIFGMCKRSRIDETIRNSAVCPHQRSPWSASVKCQISKPNTRDVAANRLNRPFWQARLFSRLFFDELLENVLHLRRATKLLYSSLIGSLSLKGM